MSSNNGYASKEAKELGEYMAQANQLRAIAQVSHMSFAPHIIEAINEAGNSPDNAKGSYLIKQKDYIFKIDKNNFEAMFKKHKSDNS